MARIGVLLGLGLLAHAAAQAAPTWRVRQDLAAPLNADAGWAAGSGETGVVQADQPFRLRFEWERPVQLTGMPGIILQYRRNEDEDWIEVGAYDFPYPEGEEPRSPRASVVHVAAYLHGEPASDLLRGSPLPFAGGSGVNLAAAAPAWSAQQMGHMELEWPLVIRRWADGAETNEAGDRFEFRLADARGEALSGAGVASITLAIAPGHVGGTFVETPGRVGPWQASNGDLYFIMEPAESSNLFMMIKSSDGGRSWREVDGAHRPRTDDLESVDGRQVGDTIEIVHQITEAVLRHAFRTSDHPTHPDTWATTDELVATERSIAQAASLVRRSDGSMVAFYVGESLRYSVRTPAGQWGPSRLIDRGSAPLLAGPQAVLGSNDTIHLAYFGGDGTIWYRRFDTGSPEPGPAIRLAEGVGTGEDAYGSVLPLVHLPGTDTVVVAYQLEDLRLRERRIGADGSLSQAVLISDRPVVREAVDSQQPGADLFAVGEALQVLFIEDGTRRVYSATDLDGWSAVTLRESGTRADWIRAMAHDTADGGKVVRYVFDAGSRGGAGMNRYGEYRVAPD